MKLPKELTTITPFSKYLAMALFVIFPILGFYLGIQYQKSIYPHRNNIPSIPIISPAIQSQGCHYEWSVCPTFDPQCSKHGGCYPCDPIRILVCPSGEPTANPINTNQYSIKPTSIPTPTLDPTIVNWQTYIDSKYGFSFRYPLHWSFANTSTQNNSSVYADEYFVMFSIKNINNPTRDSIEMGVEVHTNQNNWTLNQWFYNNANGYDPQTIQQQASSIDGYQSIQSRLLPSLENNFVVAPLSNNKSGLYDILLYGSDGEGMTNPYSDTDPFIQQEITNFHKLLSTFRFSNS